MAENKFDVYISTNELGREIKLTIAVRFNNKYYKYEDTSRHIIYLYLNDDRRQMFIEDWVESFANGDDASEVLKEIFYQLSKMS